MILFSNAKINLGLQVLRKRSDGYHDLQSLFLPVPFSDILEIQYDSGVHIGISFSQTGIAIPGNLKDNLCIKAYDIYAKHTGWNPGIRLHLHKMIPTGSGLGGGSSNASAVLLGMNSMSPEPVSTEALSQMALLLGSDCPFFMQKIPSIAEGRGEILTPIDPGITGMHIVLLHPGIHISTPDAYAEIQPDDQRLPIREIVKQPVENWKAHLINDFEQYAFKKHPELSILKEELYANGALYASMTGSGSAIYGIFPDNPNLSGSIQEKVVWKGIV